MNVNKLPLNKLVVEDFMNSGDKVAAPYFVRDNNLYLSAESEVFVADYYNEFGLEMMPEIVEWANKNNGFWEWVNPGMLMFVLN